MGKTKFTVVFMGKDKKNNTIVKNNIRINCKTTFAHPCIGPKVNKNTINVSLFCKYKATQNKTKGTS